jgi:hypothetical protein
MKITISTDEEPSKSLVNKLRSLIIREIDYPLDYGESYYECTYSCGGCWLADDNATDSVKYKCPLCHKHTGKRIYTVYIKRSDKDRICFT